jgi:protein-S-isoprenylcysteine O-methyltransferase Ste14
MSLASPGTIIRWIGALLAYATLGVVLHGIWRGTRREAGRTSGHAGSLLRLPWFYVVTSALFFGACILGWKPLPLTVSPGARVWMLVIGSLLYFPGMSLVLWGRLVLGKNYFVSTGFGAQLFAGHQLVTRGPFAIVRHPMYVGLALAALGSLLIYSTWTTLLFAIFAPLVSIRARGEEQALAAEFGEQWQEYCRRVPAFLPRLKR